MGEKRREGREGGKRHGTSARSKKKLAKCRHRSDDGWKFSHSLEAFEAATSGGDGSVRRRKRAWKALNYARIPLFAPHQLVAGCCCHPRDSSLPRRAYYHPHIAAPTGLCIKKATKARSTTMIGAGRIHLAPPPPPTEIVESSGASMSGSDIRRGAIVPHPKRSLPTLMLLQRRLPRWRRGFSCSWRRKSATLRCSSIRKAQIDWRPTLLCLLRRSSCSSGQ